jgi:pimeloyl-ACP methyl ester carboxylesterase
MQEEADAGREDMQVAGATLRYFKKGSGRPILVIHQDIGNPGWLPFHEGLAKDATVYVPDLPGWGESERMPWMRSVRDLAVVLHHFEDVLGLDGVTLVGLGMGGWIAAEMATMDRRRYERLVLVGAAGIQPAEGEILDQFLLSYDEYVRTGFSTSVAHDRVFTAEPPTETLMGWDIAREMVARVAWKPYLFSSTLPHVLGDLKLPTLVVWGAADRVIPAVCGRQYQQAIAGSQLAVLPDTGHFVEMERPIELAALIAGMRA